MQILGIDVNNARQLIKVELVSYVVDQVYQHTMRQRTGVNVNTYRRVSRQVIPQPVMTFSFNSVSM